MSNKDHNFASLVSIYSQMLPTIRAKAKELGYAIALHGTMARDLDLLAVPWIEDAAEPMELVNALADEICGYVIGDSKAHIDHQKHPTKQPHGRMSWNIAWGGNAFIDLSVMPKEKS
jgi:hypothetical protein